jgi:PKD repeat protein
MRFIKYIYILIIISCSISKPDIKLFIPTDFTINHESIRSIYLSWTDNSKHEDGYKIERRFDQEEWIVIANLDSNSEEFVDIIENINNLENNIFYRICSFEDDNKSDYAYADILNLFVSPININLYIEEIGEISLTWTDNNYYEEGYIIERKIDDFAWTIIDTLDPNTEFYYDNLTNRNNFNSVFYKIYNFEGYDISESEIVNTDIIFESPTDLFGIYSFEIVLEWTDNSVGEEGFRIERKTNNGSYELINSVNSNIELFVDENILINHIYIYRIHAYKGILNSNYSNEIILSTYPLLANYEANILSGNLPLEVEFYDFSTGNIISWYWDFGNEETSTLQNPIITYMESGSYSVSLTVSDGVNQNTKTLDDYIYVYDPTIPIADFSATPLSGYVPLVVAFTDLSTGDFDTWAWDFGNGETSDESDPTVTYSEVGLYTVSLTISAGAESSSETKTDYIEVEEFTGVFQDGFEDYDDFVLEFAPWMQYDVDGGDTWSIEGYTFQNENYIGSYIIFNPNQVDPPLEDCDPHSGNKMAACFDAVTASAPNDDWLIAPQVIIADGDEVSFFAKSYSDMYGLERFNVAVSITGTAPADFTVISAAPYIQAPTVWTEYNYDLSTYAGQSIYVAIQCVSNDAFFFLVDDFVVATASRTRTVNHNKLTPINGTLKKASK